MLKKKESTMNEKLNLKQNHLTTGWLNTGLQENDFMLLDAKYKGLHLFDGKTIFRLY